MKIVSEEFENCLRRNLNSSQKKFRIPPELSTHLECHMFLSSIPASIRVL